MFTAAVRTLGGSGGGTFGLMIVLDLLKNKKMDDLRVRLIKHSDAQLIFMKNKNETEKNIHICQWVTTEAVV